MTNKTSKVSAENLIWIDLEMTGLDPEKEKIIEIATIVTDGQLNILEEGPELVIHQPASILDAMDDWNKKQHAKSGLVEKVKRSKITVAEAERQTLDFVKKYCSPNTAPLCGNSIHHDRRFIIKYMPELDKFLHYRHIDVTSVKALVQRWYPKPKSYPKKKETHRALADIQESIKELNFLKEHYFSKV